MREILERLLQSVDVPNVERAQLHWDEYRSGAGSTDPAVKAAADAAFATLLAWYGAALYRHIWGFIRSDAAEDVFQDVLRKLHQKRQSPRLADFHANVLPWLRTVAIRECVDAHRRATRRRAREARSALPESDPRADETSELQEVLAVALARLSRDEQQAVALHFFEGLTKLDAAKALGMHRDTFATRLNAALARLQQFIPVPAGILVGGSLAIPAELAASPPTLNASRLGELVAGAWSKTCPTGWPFGKTAALLIGLALGGVAAGGWTLARAPQPDWSPPALATLPQDPPSLEERNRRLFDAQIRPQVAAAFRGLALGKGGAAEVSHVETFDSRIACGAIVRHGAPYDFTSLWNIHFDTASRAITFHLDFRGNGKWRRLDPSQPMYWKNPFTGNRIVFRFREIDAIVAAFNAVAWDDPRLWEERLARIEDVRRAAQDYVGVWYESGDAARPIRARFDPEAAEALCFTYPDGARSAVRLIHLSVGSDGRLEGVQFDESALVLSPDRQRIDLPGTGKWWTRKPLPPGD
jgi:RNA polymerase sigma-70 factor (ECF subfamily)